MVKLIHQYDYKYCKMFTKRNNETLPPPFLICLNKRGETSVLSH